MRFGGGIKSLVVVAALFLMAEGPERIPGMVMPEENRPVLTAQISPVYITGPHWVSGAAALDALRF